MSDGNELAAITLLVLSREHPCQVEDDEDEPPSTEEDDIAEIEGLLIEAAVDVVIAMAKTLKEQFAPEFGPFYRRLVKSTVRLYSSTYLTFRKARTQRRGLCLWLAWERLLELSRGVFRNIREKCCRSL